MVYLDHNATTPIDPEVLDAMLPFLRDGWGNPSSLHAKGYEAKRALGKSRDRIAAFLGAADASEIIFTSSGTESNNHAIMGVVDAARDPVTVISDPVEHTAVLGPVEALSAKGVATKEIAVDGNGQLDMAALKAELAAAEDPVLASFMWANNETGVLFPIKELARLVKEAGGVMHTDAVQAVGKLPINLQETPVDLLSFSGHKLNAPKGIGVLYSRRGTRISPLIKGGHQERNRRGGTENIPYIVGLAKACELAAASMAETAANEERLRARLEEGVLHIFPDAVVMGTDAERLPNTSNICFKQLEGEAILMMLDDRGICVSTGAACESGSIEPSHVLKAMGVERSLINGSARFSLGRATTDADIDALLEHLPNVLDRLKQLSPHY